MVVLAQPPYSLQGNGRHSPRVKQGDRPSLAEENPGAGRTSEIAGVFQIDSRKTNITRARAP